VTKIIIITKRDFWLSDTGTGQQVAQLHDRYDDDDDDEQSNSSVP